MGRYDKIKVYNGSKFVKPKRIRVYDKSTNSWVDLGDDNSDNTRSLYVYKTPTELVRATLNKKTVSVPGEQYAQGPFNLLPTNNFCFNPGTTQFKFAAESMRKVSAGDQRIFYTGSGNNYLDIYWMADGRIRVRTNTTYGGGGYRELYSSNSVGLNTWVYLFVVVNQNSNVMSITFGVQKTTGQMGAFWEISGAWNEVGSWGIQFKNNINARGAVYYGGAREVNINMTYASGSDGGSYMNVNHYNTSTTKVIWE